MESKFFRATPGWGTGNIDSVINQWLNGKNIKVIDLKYSTHSEEFADYYGSIEEATVYTATILYEDMDGVAPIPSPPQFQPDNPSVSDLEAKL